MKKNYFFIFIICIFLSFIVLAQIRAQKNMFFSSPEESLALAMEISILAKSNNDLQEEIQLLESQHSEYQESFQNNNDIQKTTMENFQKYKIISGLEELKGKGVEIKIYGQPEVPQMVDLINALRNIGTKGLSLDGNRINLFSSFSIKNGILALDDDSLTSPYIIKTIGDPDILMEALSRRGGIVEQLEINNSQITIKINKKEQIILPAKQKMKFNYAQVVEEE